MGLSIINHPFWGTPIYGNPPFDPLAIQNNNGKYPMNVHLNVIFPEKLAILPYSRYDGLSLRIRLEAYLFVALLDLVLQGRGQRLLALVQGLHFSNLCLPAAEPPPSCFDAAPSFRCENGCKHAVQDLRCNCCYA